MNNKVFRPNSRTIKVEMVRCKRHPESKLQFWSSPHCSIYSTCSACQMRTDYGERENGKREPANEHYQKFSNQQNRRIGEAIDQCMDRLQAEIESNPVKYEVSWE